MAIEKFQFMDKDNALSFANELIKHSNVRIEERIVKSIDANSTDKQLPSARLISKLFRELEASKTDAANRLDGHDTTLEEHNSALEALNESQGVQDGKLGTVEGTLADTSTLVDELTHFTIEMVEGAIDTVTEPSTTVFYLQRDNTEDTTWNIYIYTENLGWINIGDTEIDLSHIWSKDEVEEMREALQVHDAEGISLDRLTEIIDQEFANTEEDFSASGTDPEPSTPMMFSVRPGNREQVGYTEEENLELEIPETFTGDDGNEYVVNEIGDGAFEGCDNLKSVTIPGSVETIGEDAFKDCTGLEEVTIGEGVTNIGDNAFTGCVKIETVKYAGSPGPGNIQIGEGNENLTNPGSNKPIEYVDFTMTAANRYKVCSNSGDVVIPETFVDTDGTAYKIVAINGAFYNATGLTSVEIPSGVTSIGSNSFVECKNLKSVKIPEGVTTIGSSAFSGCTALTTINIPASIESIGNMAFSNCTSLATINIPNSLGNYTIERQAFRGCSGLQKVTIGQGLTTIIEYTFQNCSGLKSVIIPTSVTSIENYAFDGCSSLNTVNYRGTQTQWNNMSIHKDNSELTNANKVYNYTGN